MKQVHVVMNLVEHYALRFCAFLQRFVEFRQHCVDTGCLSVSAGSVTSSSALD